jgi:hypothetical protein
MKAALFSIGIFEHRKDRYPISRKEFIVYGRSEKEIEITAERIFEWYRQAIAGKSYHMITKGPLPISQKIRRERAKKPIDWDLLCQRQQIQDKTRDRKQGRCIFRGNLDNKRRPIPKDYKQEKEGCINYSLSIHRKPKQKQTYLFVGSEYNNRYNCRTGKVTLIEASSLDHAADICELIYLTNRPKTTLTEWCYPIYSSEIL